MYKNKIIGKDGEEIATNYLKDLGYNIIEKNFLCRSGEIDIIARDREELVFVEVKSRTNNLYGNGIDAIDKNKIKNICKTAEYYLYINNLMECFTRFDAIEIELLENKININHIKNIV